MTSFKDEVMFSLLSAGEVFGFTFSKLSSLCLAGGHYVFPGEALPVFKDNTVIGYLYVRSEYALDKNIISSEDSAKIMKKDMENDELK